MDKYLCQHCLKPIGATKTFRFRKHTDEGKECVGAGEFVPSHQLELGPIDPKADPSVPEEGRDLGTCPTCGRKLRLSADGRYPPHKSTLLGPWECANQLTPYRPVMDVVPDLGAALTPPSPEDFFATPVEAPKQASAPPAFEVSDLRAFGVEVAARLKETFYAYGNRRTSDNRSTQTHLGPSEIGSPCDRRIALSLLRVPPTNPGGDGWAAFVGTCIHAGLAEMFVWANGDTGRYATEVGLTFDSEHVPHGTADLLDRTLFMLGDHKCQGKWSAEKLRNSGPTPQYRIQIHTYAYGMRAKGEKVEYVALVSWPRDKASLDDLYVHVERYDPTIAQKALARVDDIAEEIKRREDPSSNWGAPTALRVGLSFAPRNDSGCEYCPFHSPGDKSGERGCNGL